jgi:hypothetical protein
VLSTFSLHPGAHLKERAGVSVSPIVTVHKGRTLCDHQVTVGEVAFSVDVPCGATRILWVSTNDPRFTTREGIAVGQDMEGVKKVPGARLLPDGGVQLPSGWVAYPDSATPPGVLYFSSPDEL